jgi:hypothetical protein
VNGESQADGVELSYLVPMKQYLTLTGGWYNKLGAENERVTTRCRATSPSSPTSGGRRRSSA